MRANSIIVLGGVGVLLVVIEEGMGSLMLAPLIMALKGGMFAGKMGLGGMLAMFLATTQNVHTQQGYNAGYTARDQEGSLSIAGLTKKKRTIRSIPQSVFETKLDLTTDGSNNNGTLNLNGTEDPLSAEKLAAALNNITSPASQRVMRQVAILDQLSCLPKVICGLNTKEPSQKTSVINDYGYLIKYLFERDDDADDADQDDEEADDEEDDALSRAAETMLRKKSGQSSPIKSGPNTDKLKKKKKKPSSSAEDDYDEDTEDSDEVKIDEAEFDDIPDEDENLEDKFEEMAQDELIDDEPEMLKYALAEMKHKMNKHRSKYAVDHSDVAGYDKGSYHTEQNPLLNTKSAQQILRTTPKHKKGLKGHTKDVVSNVATNLAEKGVKVGNKRFQFQFGAKDSGIGSDESSPSLFGSILPSFIYDKIRADPDSSDSKYRTKDPNDPFADDPFFDGFRRNLKFPPEDMQKSESNPAEQRTNSKFTKAEEDEAKYMARKARQLAKAKNPLTKYRVAKQVGEKTKSSRQCRMLFAKCPYEFNEIMTMINNVKKLLNEQAIVGDKEVLLKQPAAGTASIADVLGSTSSLMGATGVNLQTGQAGATGITHISQQLANGDNVEIMLKIKPKGGPVEKYSSTTAAEIAAANKSLQDMKKAIQAIAKLHNQTEYGGSGTPQFQFIQPSEIIAAAKVVSNSVPSTTLKTTTTKSTSTSTWKPVPVLKFEENTSQSEPAASPSTLAEVAPGFSGESTSSSQETSSEEASSIKQKQTNIRNKIKDLQSQPKPSQNPNQKPKPPTGPGSGSGSASGSKEDDEEGDDDQEEEDEDDEDTLDDSPVPSRHNGGGHGNRNGGYNGGHHHSHGHGHGHGTHNFGPGEGPPPFLDDPISYHGEHDDDDDNTEISFSFRQQPIKNNKNKRPPPPKPQNSNSGPVYIDFDISSKSPPPSTTYSTISGAKMRPPSPLPTRPAPYRIIRNKNSNNNGGGR